MANLVILDHPNHNRRKRFFLVLLLALQSSLFANIAESVIHGTVVSSPFTSEYVDILHEELNIIIDSNFKTASFEVILP
ncbi:MAG: hypothetical protein ACI8ZM_000606 [Crocinitomix sp.]|jgi:hypothetical protein